MCGHVFAQYVYVRIHLWILNRYNCQKSDWWDKALFCKYMSTHDLSKHNQLRLLDIQFSYSYSSISCPWSSTVFQWYCNVLWKLVHCKSTSHFCLCNLDILDEVSDTDTIAFFLVWLGFHRFDKPNLFMIICSLIKVAWINTKLNKMATPTHRVNALHIFIAYQRFYKRKVYERIHATFQYCELGMSQTAGSAEV